MLPKQVENPFWLSNGYHSIGICGCPKALTAAIKPAITRDLTPKFFIISPFDKKPIHSPAQNARPSEQFALAGGIMTTTETRAKLFGKKFCVHCPLDADSVAMHARIIFANLRKRLIIKDASTVAEGYFSGNPLPASRHRAYADRLPRLAQFQVAISDVLHHAFGLLPTACAIINEAATCNKVTL
jgi:hypothetical protein